MKMLVGNDCFFNSLYKPGRFKCFCKLRIVLFMSFVLFCLSFEKLCGSRKYPYSSHGGLRKFRGVEGSERGKFPKGRGVHKELFFPEVLKCDRINTYVLFQLILQGNQGKLENSIR